ncbi:hypothetical protein TBLA_0C04180 [Henningerozyma blattae CBS 6284]|uniref:Methionyl-tRNA formyltransferase, mitochondrial n=1 Tax=Henningerozyma blattae (strain ATCC 34711 / CBS 6284 / DSM 70876 / NBRC 10599 / NRRL Y-10934 / UCD 77-7) TaxID=1071380 RepID=I2H1G6_HENB6|nr:hypothetical protein TBLA_0C04180 [Tetrapisispora blattae CBS 6284]CCH60218.1 hypothetical protein TBLA_0C04180 [Tetrapisispora blattae CBS 6284]
MNVSRIFIRKYSLLPNLKPLNILFFGSDTFSVQSFEALQKLRTTAIPGTNLPYVDRIQIVTKPGKWCGRDKSTFKETAIAIASKKVPNVPLIECDNMKDLMGLTDVVTKNNINTLIAVSYGKLIPDQLIKTVPYCMNVHPSLLPRYKGASPIQYSLLNKDKYTGVTIQSLHPTKFDCGEVISQTELLSIVQLLELPSSKNRNMELPLNTSKLTDQLGIKGGEMLQNVITNGLYLAGMHNNPVKPGIKPSFAPRISNEMKRIIWATEDAKTILNKKDVLGPVYTYINCRPVTKKKQRGSANSTQEFTKRIIIHDFSVIDNTNNTISDHLKPGSFKYSTEMGKLLIKAYGPTLLAVDTLQFEGFAKETAEMFINRLHKRGGSTDIEKANFV